jgi:hypothetical protein
MTWSLGSWKYSLGLEALRASVLEEPDRVNRELAVASLSVV